MSADKVSGWRPKGHPKGPRCLLLGKGCREKCRKTCGRYVPDLFEDERGGDR